MYVNEIKAKTPLRNKNEKNTQVHFYRLKNKSLKLNNTNKSRDKKK